MPENKKMSKNTMDLMNDHHYPSSVDNMIESVDHSQGSDTALPELNNPVFGADGKIPVSKVIKTK